MIRLGLIGCGQWGWRYLPAAVVADNARITHVARASNKGFLEDKASAGVHPVEVVDDWHSLMSAPVDAFIVATPPEPREEICCELLSRGFPVMAEKPMSLTVGAALEIQEAARKSGAPFLVNHIHLFSRAYELLREKVIELGPRRWRVYSRGGGSGPNRSYSALWDYGPHDVAMCLGLGLGNPTSVDCMRIPDEYGCVHLGSRRFDVRIGFGQSEASVQVWNGALPKERKFEVVTEGTRLVYDDLEPAGLYLRCNNQPLLNKADLPPPLTRAVHAFAEAVRTGRTDWRFGAEMGVVVTRILQAADSGIVHA